VLTSAGDDDAAPSFDAELLLLVGRPSALSSSVALLFLAAAPFVVAFVLLENDGRMAGRRHEERAALRQCTG
jgi:hypothetical protein